MVTNNHTNGSKGSTGDARAWSDAHKAQTLMAAHAAVLALRPGPGTPPAVWMNFRLRASAVYQRMAEVDPGHESEALYWANREKAKADELAARPAPSSTTASRRPRTRQGKTPAADAMPTTLAGAQDALQELRPAADASPETWSAYHRYAAAIYTEVSDMDRGHHHEALYWAGQARAEAIGHTGPIDDGPAARSLDKSSRTGKGGMTCV